MIPPPGGLCEPIPNARAVPPPLGQRPSCPFPRGKITSIFSPSFAVECLRSRDSQPSHLPSHFSFQTPRVAEHRSHLLRTGLNLIFFSSKTNNKTPLQVCDHTDCQRARSSSKFNPLGGRQGGKRPSNSSSVRSIKLILVD